MANDKRDRGKRRRNAPRRNQPRKKPGVNERVEELDRPLRRVLERLPATQREVLEWRMGLKDGHPHDLGDTAREMGLTMHEAREIEQRAFEHIREAVPLQQLQKYLQG